MYNNQENNYSTGGNYSSEYQGYNYGGERSYTYYETPKPKKKFGKTLFLLLVVCLIAGGSAVGGFYFGNQMFKFLFTSLSIRKFYGYSSIKSWSWCKDNFENTLDVIQNKFEEYGEVIWHTRTKNVYKVTLPENLGGEVFAYKKTKHTYATKIFIDHLIDKGIDKFQTKME